MIQPPQLVAQIDAGKRGGIFSSLSHYCKYRHSVVYKQQETIGIVGNVVQTGILVVERFGSLLPLVANRLYTTRSKDEEVKAAPGSEVRAAARQSGR